MILANRIYQKTQKQLRMLREKFNDLVITQVPVAYTAQEFVSCENLVKIYQDSDLEVFALQGLDLKIKKGELIGIIGSSGSGKSTLLSILGGLAKPTAGKVRVAGWDINKLSYRDKIKYKRETVGFVWQNTGSNLIPYFNLLENVGLPMYIKGHKPDLAWARQLLTAVGLKDKLASKIIELSGGERQRVAIAVALANKPDILLADEPTGSLDSITAKEIFRVFKDICQMFNTTVIVVTHDLNLASSVERVVEIRDGKISTESIRNIDLSVEEFSQDLVTGFDSGETHNHYSVLDSAGRLQLPKEYLRELAIKERVMVKMEKERIIITADEQES